VRFCRLFSARDAPVSCVNDVAAAAVAAFRAVWAADFPACFFTSLSMSIRLALGFDDKPLRAAMLASRLARAVPIDRSALVTDLTGFLAGDAAAGLEDDVVCDRRRLAIMSSEKGNKTTNEKRNETETCVSQGRRIYQEVVANLVALTQ
jgi:hypothetical protein